NSFRIVCAVWRCSSAVERYSFVDSNCSVALLCIFCFVLFSWLLRLLNFVCAGWISGDNFTGGWTTGNADHHLVSHQFLPVSAGESKPRFDYVVLAFDDSVLFAREHGGAHCDADATILADLFVVDNWIHVSSWFDLGVSKDLQDWHVDVWQAAKHP